MFIVLSCFASLIYLIIYPIIFDSIKEIKTNLEIKWDDEVTNELIKLLSEEGSLNYTYSLVMVIICSIALVLIPFLVKSYCYGCDWEKKLILNLDTKYNRS